MLHVFIHVPEKRAVLLDSVHHLLGERAGEGLCNLSSPTPANPKPHFLEGPNAQDGPASNHQ